MTVLPTNSTKPTPISIAMLGAVALLALASQVQASPRTLLDHALPVARSAWPDSPCLGRETVVWDDAEVRRAYPTGPIMGMAYAGSCRVVFSAIAPTDRVGFCNLLTHELGHLAGFDHVIGGVGRWATMDPTPGRWAACDLPRRRPGHGRGLR